MPNARNSAVFGLLILLAAGTALAQTKTVVPLKGQTPEQVTADQQQCAAEASSQTGYNPSAPPQPVAKPQMGARAAGAARGAATGKVTSNVTKNETDAAVDAGAKVGAMAGGARQRQANRGTRQEAKQQQAANQQKQAAYGSAVSTCLQARGYSLQ